MQNLIYAVGVGCANMHAREAQLQITRHMAVSDAIE